MRNDVIWLKSILHRFQNFNFPFFSLGCHASDIFGEAIYVLWDPSHFMANTVITIILAQQLGIQTLTVSLSSRIQIEICWTIVFPGWFFSSVRSFFASHHFHSVTKILCKLAFSMGPRELNLLKKTVFKMCND